MWRPYKYQKGGLKLIKDLKYGKPHLRNSLIDIEQIDDLGKTFLQRKEYYKIEEQIVNLQTKAQNCDEVEYQMEVTPEQRILQYRKTTQSNKMKDKFRNMFKEQNSRHFNIKPTPLHKMLSDWKQTSANEENINIMRSVKESEKQLSAIKINGQQKIKYKQYNAKIGRPRFLSLQTSTFIEKQFFPTYHEYLRQRFAPKPTKPVGINIMNLQGTIDNFLLHRKDQKDSKVEQQIQQLPRQERYKVKSSYQRTFTRSEAYSQQAISTLSNFRESKKAIKQDVSLMVQFLQRDRPLTSQIRRKHYVNPVQNDSLLKCRKISEQQRLYIRQRNQQFYISLLQSIEGNNEEEMSTSLFLLEQLRLLLESNYILNDQDIEQVLNKIKGMPEDPQLQGLTRLIQTYSK